MSTAAFTAVLIVFLTRQLGPAGYGTFALAIGITGVVLRPAAGGTSQAAARFIAERHGDMPAITGVLGMALRTRLLTASAIAVALFALAGPISDALQHAGAGLAAEGGGDRVLRTEHDELLAQRIHRPATDLPDLRPGDLRVGRGVQRLGRARPDRWRRDERPPSGGRWGTCSAPSSASLLLGRLLSRSPLFNTGRSPVRRREFMNYAGAMLIAGGASSLFSYLDTLLIGAFLTTTAVGIYSAPLRLTALVGYPALALAQGVAPRMARHPDEPPRVAALERAIGYIVILQAAVVVAFLLLWADPIVRLVLGSEFSESAEVIRALTPFVLLTSVTSLLTSPLNYAGEGRRRIPIVFAALIVNAAIDVVLIPEIGVLGAAVGTDVAYAVYGGAHLWLCHRLLDLPLKPLAATAGRAAARRRRDGRGPRAGRHRQPLGARVARGPAPRRRCLRCHPARHPGALARRDPDARPIAPQGPSQWLTRQLP